MKHFIVGTDGSDGARAAIEEALDLAASMNAKVTFVSVLRAADALVRDQLYRQQIREELADARVALAEALEQAEDAGVQAKCRVLEGHAADALVAFAREQDADVIVVGSRGLGALRGVLVGSVSRSVTRHADRPVLVVKRETAPRRVRIRKVA
jgi:nucleotide-binding universal stress UspA family protein